jgi:hypothetical protein
MSQGSRARGGLALHLDAPIRLHPHDLREIARLVALELHSGSTNADGLIDPAEVARRYGVSRAWVYEHARELGGVRLGAAGEGKRPRWRFAAEEIDQRITRLAHRETPTPTAAPTKARPRRAAGRTRSGSPLLPIAGER